MIKKILTMLFKAIIRHPMTVLVIVGIVTILSIISMLYLDFETDVTTLLPGNSPVTQTYQRTIETFKSFDYTFVILEANNYGRENLLIDAAETLAPALDNPYIFSVDYRFDPRLEALYSGDKQSRLASLLLREDLKALISQYDTRELGQHLIRLSRKLDSAFLPVERSKILADPLNLDSVLRRKMIVSRGPSHFPLRRGYFLSRDGKMLVMVLRPQEPASDLRFSTNLLYFLERVRETLIDDDLKYKDQINVSFYGPHVESVINTRMIRNDLIQTLVTSFVGVLFLFFVVFRRREALLFVGLPLLVGILWTLGLTQVVLGRLTVVTFAFGAVLIGLGIDFAIHIYNRFLEERRKAGGRLVSRPLNKALSETGHGVFLGAITTAAAFYAMFFTSFRGFRELGFVAGSGILCCLASIFLLLPVLIRYLAPQKVRLKRPAMASFGLSRLYRTVTEYPRLFIIVGLIITVYFAFQARRVQFEERFSSLKQSTLPYAELYQRLASRFDIPSNQILAIVSDDTLQGVLEKNDRLYENLALQDKYPYISCETLRSFLPSVKTQKESRDNINEIIGSRYEEIAGRVSDMADETGLAEEAVQPLTALLRGLLEGASEDAPYITYATLEDPFVIRLVQSYLVKRGRQYKIITRIYPPAGKWESRVPTGFPETLSRGIDNVEFTGAAVIAEEIQALVKRDLAVVLLLVCLSVFLILLFAMGGLKKALFAIFPVFCGCIWMLGTIHIFGIQLNFLNVIVIPMILGVGVDNGIHLVQRYFESGDHPDASDLQKATVKTGRALLMTSLTTMVGFGSLSLANFQGVREMGLLSIFGIAYCLISSIVLLTAILSIWGRRGRISDIIGSEGGEIR